MISMACIVQIIHIILLMWCRVCICDNLLPKSLQFEQLSWNEAICHPDEAPSKTASSSNRFIMFNEDEIKPQQEYLVLTMNKRFDNPFMGSDFSMLYGKVEAEMKAAKGQGIVSSIYLQNEQLDEIDIIETFGSLPHTFQTNFFIKGDISNYDRGVYHISNTAITDEFNRITLVWDRDKICWFYNDLLIREVHKGNPHGFPDTPMSIRLSLWAGGDPENVQGTIDWAGGPTDFNQLPVSMYVNSLYITDESTGKHYFYKANDQLRIQDKGVLKKHNFQRKNSHLSII